MAADTREGRPGLLRLGAALLAVEGLGLLASGLWLAIRSLGHDASNRAAGATGAFVAILAAAGVLLLARGAAAHKRWVRSPVIVLQILFLPVGWGLVQSGRPEIGVPMLLLPIATLVVLGMAGALTPE